MTDYKKYSLENLENWLYDAMSAGEATPQEIYDTIVGVVKDNYYTYKQKASEAYELLGLLNDNGQSYEDVMKERQYYEQSNITEQELSQYKDSLICDKDDPSPECQGAWNDFWESSHQEYLKTKVDGYSVDNKGHSEYWYEYNRNDPNRESPFKKDKIVKWQLPVEECKDVDTDKTEYFISFPDDLLEAANLKEGDQIEWIDRGDGSFELRKVSVE